MAGTLIRTSEGSIVSGSTKKVLSRLIHFLYSMTTSLELPFGGTITLSDKGFREETSSTGQPLVGPMHPIIKTKANRNGLILLLKIMILFLEKEPARRERLVLVGRLIRAGSSVVLLIFNSNSSVKDSIVRSPVD